MGIDLDHMETYIVIGIFVTLLGGWICASIFAYNLYYTQKKSQYALNVSSEQHTTYL